MSQSPNHLLSRLPHNVFAALAPNLRTTKLAFGALLAETGRVVGRVYFPHTGVISLVVRLEAGQSIETAMIGRDGAVNATAALDGRISHHTGLVQIEGAASAIGCDTLRSICDDFKPLGALLIRHEQALMAQAQQSAACNASHSVEARMCRWLLRIHDLTQSDEVRLTQEFLAQMLGVRRTSVSLVAGILQKSGLISYRRGSIKINDVNKLRGGACECYERVQKHYEKVIAV